MSNKLPNWLETAVFYQIYPQSFFDTNGDGIGDLQGIIAKLDYILELGCNAIWINPCFESPFLDAGYDITNYYAVAKRYGTNEDLKNVFEQAHKRNIHVLLDLVPGHTSMQNPGFQKSSLAEKNEYTDRYVWTSSVWDIPPQSYISGFSQRNGCCVTNYFSHQPALNYGYYERDENKPWQQPPTAEGPRANVQELKNIMRFWLNMGCDGFRVDMAPSLVTNDPERKGAMALWQEIRAFLDAEFPQAAMISEWGEPDKSIAGGFHMDFILPFKPFNTNSLFRCATPYFSAKGGSAAEFVQNFEKMYADTNSQGLICLPTGSHDCGRISGSLTQAELKLAYAFILTMPGAPFIYYGDEIGMRPVKNLKSVEGSYGRNNCRTPMQWGSGPNAGFSSADPKSLYLPLDPDENRPTVAAQQSNETSLWRETQRLIALRKQHSALGSSAKVEFILAKDALIYCRENQTEKITVCINPKATAVTAEKPQGELLYQNGDFTLQGNSLVLKPQSAVLFLKKF